MCRLHSDVVQLTEEFWSPSDTEVSNPSSQTRLRTTCKEWEDLCALRNSREVTGTAGLAKGEDT